MNLNFQIIEPQSRGNFIQQLTELETRCRFFLNDEAAQSRCVTSVKVYLSDISNQAKSFKKSNIYNLFGAKRVSIIGQPPLSGCKIALFVTTGDDPSRVVTSCFRLNESEAECCDAYEQTRILFQKYVDAYSTHYLHMPLNCMRTWIYVRDLDVNFDGVTTARRDFFRDLGMDVNTHFISSTLVGGSCDDPRAFVAIDFLSVKGVREEDKLYLNADDVMQNTHSKGYTFERGTRLDDGEYQQFFISGTHSADRHGNVVYSGDVARQTEHILKNIDSLLSSGGSSLSDMRLLLVYLRDMSDYTLVNEIMKSHFPSSHYLILLARILRPDWLVEIEGIAMKRVVS